MLRDEESSVEVWRPRRAQSAPLDSEISKSTCRYIRTGSSDRTAPCVQKLFRRSNPHSGLRRTGVRGARNEHANRFQKQCAHCRCSARRHCISRCTGNGPEWQYRGPLCGPRGRRYGHSISTAADARGEERWLATLFSMPMNTAYDSLGLPPLCLERALAAHSISLRGAGWAGSLRPRYFHRDADLTKS